MRHPDHQPTSENPVWYWAHHEKLVCIDQKVTFMGGKLLLRYFNTQSIEKVIYFSEWIAQIMLQNVEVVEFRFLLGKVSVLRF